MFRVRRARLRFTWIVPAVTVVSLLTVPGRAEGQSGPLTVTETAANEGYSASATDTDIASDAIPSTNVNNYISGAQIPGTFTNYFNSNTYSASSYVEDARQELLFTYTVTNTGPDTLTGLSVSGSVGGTATCSQGNGLDGLDAGRTLDSGGYTTCTATHITTKSDIENAEATQSISDVGTATGYDSVLQENVTGSDSNDPGVLLVPVYGLDTVVPNTALPNSTSSYPLVLNPCTPGTSDESSCINQDLNAISLNNSPLQSKTVNPAGGYFQGNISPSAIPVILDLDGQSYTVDEGIQLSYPCNKAKGYGCIGWSSLNPDNPLSPHYNPDTFKYSAKNEADPGESDIWLENGVLTDAGSTVYNPVIQTELGNDIYISDVESEGSNTSQFSSANVGNAGIATAGTSNLVLLNFTAFKNHGDGMDLEPYLCGSSSADCGRTVVMTWNPLTTDGGPWNGIPQDADPTIGYNGRDVLTPAGVTFSTFDNIVADNIYAGAINAESDSGNTNPGSMTFNNLFLAGMIEFADTGQIGPITFNDWVNLARYNNGGYTDTELWISTDGLANPWAGPVTVNDSDITCGGYSAGPYNACIMGQNVVAPSGTSSCGSDTPFVSGDAWVQGDPCSPGIIINDSAINITNFVASDNRRISDGVWDQFNDDCVVDTGTPPNGSNTQGVVANSDGNQYEQINDDGNTFETGTVCGALAASPPTGDTIEPLAFGQSQSGTEVGNAYGITLSKESVGTINATPVGTSSFTVGTAAQCSPEGDPSAFQATTSGTWSPVLTSGDMSVTDPSDIPPGMSWQDNGDGSLTVCGTPTTVGTYTFTVQANNGSGTLVTQSFTVTVAS